MSDRRAGAFTLIELLCVVAIIAILAALLLPVLNRGQEQARRIQCVNHLKEAGHAFHAYAHDHNGRFPMQLPMDEGGSQEFVQNGYRVAGEFYFSFRHFAALSNELVTPKILACPADRTRFPAPNFASFNNESLSYFIGVNAEFNTVGAILAGDRNITNDLAASPTLVRSSSANPFRWTEELHRFKGNLLFADGHVEELNEARLTSAGAPALNADLVLPTVKASGIAGPGVSVSPPAAAPFTTVAVVKRPAPQPPTPVSPLIVLPAAVQTAVPVPVAVAQTNLPAAPAVEPETNTPAAPPASDASPAPGGSGFTDLMEDIAAGLSLPVWVLYLLLLLLLAGIGTLLLRLRSR